jgi:glycosyltransferase 2 family protein
MLLAIEIAVSIVLLAVLFSRVDVAALWASARRASTAWLLVALGLYLMNVLLSTWRWRLLLDAQGVSVPSKTLFSSYLVAFFFNNFLPSIIGGDVVRIRDTARPAQSKTLATTVVLMDRVLGLMGLVLVAALGATIAWTTRGHAAPPVWPSWLWAGFVAGAAAMLPAVLSPSGVARVLQPLARLHPEWVGERIQRLTSALARFRDRPGALAGCFTGAVVVQTSLVAYYLAVVYALNIPITFWDLAVIVPLSFIIQMLPISLNGFGVREATFSLYFSRLGLPIQSALLMSLMATGLMMLFSLSGAAVYLTRSR